MRCVLGCSWASQHLPYWVQDSVALGLWIRCAGYSCDRRWNWRLFCPGPDIEKLSLGRLVPSAQSWQTQVATQVRLTARRGDASQVQGSRDCLSCLGADLLKTLVQHCREVRIWTWSLLAMRSRVHPNTLVGGRGLRPSALLHLLGALNRTEASPAGRPSPQTQTQNVLEVVSG